MCHAKCYTRTALFTQAAARVRAHKNTLSARIQLQTLTTETDLFVVHTPTALPPWMTTELQTDAFTVHYILVWCAPVLAVHPHCALPPSVLRHSYERQFTYVPYYVEKQKCFLPKTSSSSWGVDISSPLGQISFQKKSRVGFHLRNLVFLLPLHNFVHVDFLASGVSSTGVCCSTRLMRSPDLCWTAQKKWELYICVLCIDGRQIWSM